MIPTWVCYRILLYCGRWYRLRRCCRSAYWKTEQILWSLCALYALRTLQLHLRPTEYSWKVSRLRKRKATCTETWPSLLKVLDGLHHMDISESSRLLPCTIVYNMCENKSVCNLLCFNQVSVMVFLNTAVLFLGCWNKLRKITHKAKETWQNVPAVCCLNTFKWFNDK